MNKLYKSATDRKVCGVCGGIADYLGVDSTVVRLIACILFFAFGLSLWVYVIASLIMPEPPVNAYNQDSDINSNNSFGE